MSLRARAILPRPPHAHPLDVTFGDLAKLVGADVNRSGTQITVTLFWQGQAVTTTNYTAFVQLLIGTDGSIAQQIDNWQIAFDAPTSTWLPGQVIADQYVFEVSSSANSPTPRSAWDCTMRRRVSVCPRSRPVSVCRKIELF